MVINHSEKLGNKYTLLDRIGTGGMAEVFRGKLSGAEGFEKLVVLKKLLSEFSHDAEIVAHFISEAKLAALLQHENIAQIYDFGELDGSHFIAMEYLFGKDLHSVMQRAREMNDPMGVEIALMIVAKICEGMEYAHSLRDFQQQPLHIIHRDLSPHNIFITYEGRVKIIDFGIARAELFDNKTQAGVAKGKLSYMSPEQLAAERIDQRSDIFAIGILLYEMLSGKRMYSGDTATMIRKCMQVEYDKLQVVCPGFHPAIYEILDKSLEKDVGRRYQSCAHMQADVEESLFNINKRPNAHLLERYLGRLFAGELAAEKKGLSQSLASASKASEQTVVVPSSTSRAIAGQSSAPAQENTLEAAKLTPLAGPLPQSIDGFSKERPRRRFRKVMLVLAGIICVFLVVIWKLGSDWDIGEPSAPDAQQAISVPAQELPRPEVLPDSAAHHMAKGMFLAPKDGRFSLLQESFEGKRQKIINQLAEKAEVAMQSDHLTTPANNNAYLFYSEILELDPQNAVAQKGITRLADRCADLAEDAYRNLQIPRTREYVRQGLTVNPHHQHLLELQKDLTGSKLGIFFKSVEKSFGTMFQ